MNHKPPLPDKTRHTARDLRSSGTDAEHALWYHLRAARLGGFKFRRQHPIPPYVADFYCHELRLIVELDGSQHNEQTDATRTRTLEHQGLRILRFWDNQVLQEMDAVLETILSIAQIPPPEGCP